MNDICASTAPIYLPIFVWYIPEMDELTISTTFKESEMIALVNYDTDYNPIINKAIFLGYL